MDPQLSEDIIDAIDSAPQEHDNHQNNHTTNDLPSPDHHVNPEHDDHGEHTAFLPTLHFAGGNELGDLHSYTSQHGAEAAMRSNDTTFQNVDHWPMDTQGHLHDDGSLDNVAQFEQNDVSHHQYTQDGEVQPHHHNHQDEQDLKHVLQQDQNQEQHMQHSQAHHMHDQHQLHQQHHQHGTSPYARPMLGASYGTYDGSKPKRKRASPQQLTLLNNIFEMTYFPSSELRLAIGNELDMVPRSVQIWFQNRRSNWRAKASQILKENKAKKEELLAQGMTEEEADAKIKADRAEIAARQIAHQRANDAVEYAINGNAGSLAFPLSASSPNSEGISTEFDDGSVTRDDEAGAWGVLQQFHQARTGIMVPQGHLSMPQRSGSEQASQAQQLQES